MSVATALVRDRVRPLRWARQNLFGTRLDALLTSAFAVLLFWAGWRGVRFVFSTGRWEIIRNNVPTLLVGLFPRTQLWRTWLLTFAVTTTVGFLTGMAHSRRRAEDPSLPPAEPKTVVLEVARRTWPLLALVVVLLAFRPSVTGVVLCIALGGATAAAWLAGTRVSARRNRIAGIGAFAWSGLAFWLVIGAGGVGWDKWGGLLLTMFLATAGIAISFPIGVLLALGRRSTLPGVRVVCVGYIELIRGVPLITLLFMGSFVIGFLFPPGTTRPSLVTRALIAIIAFTAAYIAEIVRGGLQAVPVGQVEAAQAVGLSPVATARLIVLPQALRAVIPAIVGQFISLFKDTSLVAIIGLTDLLRIGQSVTSQPTFFAQGLQAEVLVFVSFVYWVIAYSMSKASQRLEVRLGVGVR